MRFSVAWRSQIANVPAIFEEGVLKASARSEKRELRFTRESDGFQNSFGVCVRTCRDAPNPIEIAELDLCIGDRLGMNPDTFGRTPCFSGQFKGHWNRLVRDDRGIIIADERHAELRRHAGKIACLPLLLKLEFPF